jgi:hypothetical protein
MTPAQQHNDYAQRVETARAALDRVIEATGQHNTAHAIARIIVAQLPNAKSTHDWDAAIETLLAHVGHELQAMY